MASHHPCPDAPWRRVQRGVFVVDDDFYARSGCILQEPPHYRALVARPGAG
jgi:hypothetical protein